MCEQQFLFCVSSLPQTNRRKSNIPIFQIGCLKKKSSVCLSHFTASITRGVFDSWFAIGVVLVFDFRLTRVFHFWSSFSFSRVAEEAGSMVRKMCVCPARVIWFPPVDSIEVGSVRMGQFRQTRGRKLMLIVGWRFCWANALSN